MRPRIKSIFRYTLIAIAVLLIAIQFIPFGHSHTNPPMMAEPQWNSPQTRELFFRGCKDCHSNQTEWPWYSNIAPVSWLVQDDVDKGRSRFDVSEWGRPKKNKGNAAADEVRQGDMPLPMYKLIHSNARLTPDEKQKLIDGLVKTFGEE